MLPDAVGKQGAGLGPSLRRRLIRGPSARTSCLGLYRPRGSTETCSVLHEETMAENVLYSLSQIAGDPESEGFAFASDESLRGKEHLVFDFDPDDIRTK